MCVCYDHGRLEDREMLARWKSENETKMHRFWKIIRKNGAPHMREDDDPSFRYKPGWNRAVDRVRNGGRSKGTPLVDGYHYRKGRPRGIHFYKEKPPLVSIGSGCIAVPVYVVGADIIALDRVHICHSIPAEGAATSVYIRREDLIEARVDFPQE